MNEKELYWLAGLFEADGSFGTARKNNSRVPRLVMGMCDREIIERVGKLLDLTVHKDKTPYGRPFYKINTTGGYAAHLMIMLKPLLGKRRNAQIEQALRLFEGSIKKKSITNIKPNEIRLIRFLSSAGLNNCQIGRIFKRDNSNISRAVRYETHKDIGI